MKRSVQARIYVTPNDHRTAFCHGFKDRIVGAVSDANPYPNWADDRRKFWYRGWLACSAYKGDLRAALLAIGEAGWR